MATNGQVMTQWKCAAKCEKQHQFIIKHTYTGQELLYSAWLFTGKLHGLWRHVQQLTAHPDDRIRGSKQRNIKQHKTEHRCRMHHVIINRMSTAALLITIGCNHDSDNQPQSEYKHSLTFRIRNYVHLQCIRLRLTYVCVVIATKPVH